MRTPFIAGNWKMNKTAEEAAAFANEIKDELNAIEGVDIAFCPPFLAIPAVAEAVAGTKIGVGAQNMYFEESGAYTGEIAPNMITPYCQYVILGHSERRAYFGETDEGVNKKIKAALAAWPHAHRLCRREPGTERGRRNAGICVSGQVRAAFDGLSAEEMAGCVIAYEPIWAIGTGRDGDRGTGRRRSSAAPCARRWPICLATETAEKVRIQYGGSVKPENAAEFMAHPDIDGALVGGAALKASFVDLVRNSVV